MTLARLLQPSIVVMEDVDLIARERSQMDSPCEEVLLNKLLNEMDGLKEEADILFILTTNRPQALEVALASRPGRVDQAIEFPLPDEDGRRKLVSLRTAERVQERDDLLRLGNGIAAQDSVVTSIACFTLWPDSYEEVVANTILLGGDTDTIAAMAGAISGAYLGVSAIPKHFLDALEDGHKGKSYIEQLAEQLAAICRAG